MRLRAVFSALIAAVLVTLPHAGLAADLDSRLALELDRLDGALAKVDSAAVPEEVRGLIKGDRDALASARRASSPLLRLYRLRDGFVGVETLLSVAGHKEACGDLAKFGALWREREPRFEATPKSIKGSALQLALRDGARNRAQKLFRASLPYAKVSSPFSGVYYLSEAEGNLRFSRFVESLPMSSGEREPAPSAASLSAALDSLERETLTAFEGNPTGRSTIPVSAHLKETRELLDQKDLAAATLSLLETRLSLSQQKKQTAPGNTAPAASPAEGGSMSALLAAMVAEAQPDTSRVIQSDVVPLYISLLRSPM